MDYAGFAAQEIPQPAGNPKQNHVVEDAGGKAAGPAAANDVTPGRNPAAWTVSASNDNLNWTLLDTQTGQGATPTSTFTWASGWPLIVQATGGYDNWAQQHAGGQTANEAADAKNPPPQGAVLFAGSSSIRMWQDTQKYFPATPVTNRGFGGSQMEHLVHYADRIIIPYKPKLVLVYEGDNDLASGKTPDKVLAGFKDFVAQVHAKLPETRIAYISIKPSPSRWALVEKMKQANQLIKDYTATDKRLTFIDVFTPMLDADGTPRAELFRDDKLHMNEAGYKLWQSIIEPYLKSP